MAGALCLVFLSVFLWPLNGVANDFMRQGMVPVSGHPNGPFPSAFGSGCAHSGGCGGFAADAMRDAAAGEFFASGKQVPAMAADPAGGYRMSVDHAGFDSGLFDHIGGTDFVGLEGAWEDAADAALNPSRPMGAPFGLGPDGAVREALGGQFVDSLAAGEKRDAFFEAMRTGVTWSDPLPQDAEALVGQKLAQGMQDGIFAQAFTQMFLARSGPSGSFDPGDSDGKAEEVVQMVAQDMAGYLSSCFGCRDLDVPAPLPLRGEAPVVWLIPFDTDGPDGYGSGP
ncbi:MAG: hypothetical protein ACE5FN_09315 [Leptospirillia bacterium]